MKIAILSAGPSLTRTFDPDEQFDLRIGVNRAAGTCFCDWWSCGDGQTFHEHEPVGYPALFTITDSDANLRAHSSTRDRLAKHRLVTWGSVGTDLAGRGLPPTWTNWSITAAIPLAVHLGATVAHVYGHDMTGTVDVSGRRLDKRAELWPRVSRDWSEVKGWAESQGVKIYEHQDIEVCA